MIQLSTRDVEKIVAHVFDVPDTDKLALRARLENLRKKGCPGGLATGRGKVAKFDFDQVTVVAVALALIDAGLSPDCAVSAMEDEEGLVRECFTQLAIQKPSPDELRAALQVGQWRVEKTITARCSMHRLLSSPRDEGVRIATWTFSNFDGGSPNAVVGFSAVSIDLGALFLRLIKAIAKVSDADQFALADELLTRLEEHGVRP